MKRCDAYLMVKARKANEHFENFCGITRGIHSQKVVEFLFYSFFFSVVLFNFPQHEKFNLNIKIE